MARFCRDPLFSVVKLSGIFCVLSAIALSHRVIALSAGGFGISMAVYVTVIVFADTSIREEDILALFRYVAFVGAAFMLVSVAPWSETVSFWSRLVGAAALMWGGFYFMIRENEVLYGSVSVIFAVLTQPLYAIEFSMGFWMIIAFLAAGYLLLSGLLCIKIEKAHAEARAKIEAELEMYRKNEEKLRQQNINHRY